MVTRREWLGITMGAGAAVGAALGATPRLLAALQASLPQGRLLERAIPSSGERIPVIGLGSIPRTFQPLLSAQSAASSQTRWWTA